MFASTHNFRYYQRVSSSVMQYIYIYIYGRPLLSLLYEPNAFILDFNKYKLIFPFGLTDAFVLTASVRRNTTFEQTMIAAALIVHCLLLQNVQSRTNRYAYTKGKFGSIDDARQRGICMKHGLNFKLQGKHKINLFNFQFPKTSMLMLRNATRIQNYGIKLKGKWNMNQSTTMKAAINFMKSMRMATITLTLVH